LQQEFVFIMPALYADMANGVAGDMFLAALFELGVAPATVVSSLRPLQLGQFDIVHERRCDAHGFIAGYCIVRDLHENHTHRHLTQILELIERVDAAPRVRQRAAAVFRRLAEAEAQVHGCDIDSVHFHEVGALDAIVDIVGVCVALEQLQIDRVYASTFTVGSGTIKCAHGTLPTPAPATLQLLQGWPVRRLPLSAELTTPTGAALVTTLAETPAPMPTAIWQRYGIGHGQRDFAECANIFRAVVLQDMPAASMPAAESIELLETDIDDQSPELTAAVAAPLFAAGALDVTMTPLLMKKGRAGVRITVLAPVGQAAALAQIVFRHTSSIGVRITPVKRLTLPRQAAVVTTAWGEVAAKRVQRPQGVELVPEYEACLALAQQHDVPVRSVYQAAVRAGVEAAAAINSESSNATQ